MGKKKMIVKYYVETETALFYLYQGELTEEEITEWNRELSYTIEKCKEKSKKQIKE